MIRFGSRVLSFFRNVSEAQEPLLFHDGSYRMLDRVMAENEMIRTRNNPCCLMTAHTGCLVIGWLTMIGSNLLIGVSARLLYVGFVIKFDTPWCTPIKAIAAITNEGEESYDADCTEESVDQSLAKLVGIAFLVIGFMSVFPAASLLYGTYKRCPRFLLPYIIIGVLDIIATFILTIIAWTREPVTIAFALVFFMAAGIYAVIVVCYHYSYLCEEQSQNDVTMS